MNFSQNSDEALNEQKTPRGFVVMGEESDEDEATIKKTQPVKTKGELAVDVSDRRKSDMTLYIFCYCFTNDSLC